MGIKQRIVTIDGPSGSGKSTVSKILAEKLFFTYLDTGAMYRAVAFRCQEKGIELGEGPRLDALLATLDLVLLAPANKGDDIRVMIDGREIGDQLRTPEMGMLASRVSALASVRKTLTRLQQKLGSHGRVVAEGRDTGTVVFPNAAWKFFLDASPEVRARRRAAQLRSKGQPVDEDLLLAQILKRDRDDRDRALAPLTAAADALIIDSTGLSLEQVVGRMYEKILITPCCSGS